MTDDNTEDTSHPYFVHGGFPFVFLPSTLTTGFTFANNQTHVSTTDNQTATESKTKKENEEIEEEEEEEEEAETIDDDETDRNQENDGNTNEKNDLRISQPKYSQLLKELDFSQARMVDVTNLLSNELDQEEENFSTSDENESPKKKPLGDNKYHSSSSSSSRSSISSDEVLDHQTSNNNKEKQDKKFLDAVDDVQNDLNSLAAIIHGASQISVDKNQEENSKNLNNLAAIIHEASQISVDKNEEENSRHLNNDIHKKHTFDEDDDTSKQATQDYDLHDNEQEDIVLSSKSTKNSRLTNQHSNSIRNENKPSTPNKNTQNQRTKQEDDDEDEEQQQTSFTWENLVNGADPIIQPPSEFMFSQRIIEPHSTPKKTPQQPIATSDEKSKPRTSSTTKKNIHQQFRQIISSSSSSSDTDSVVEHGLHRSKKEQPPSLPKQPPSLPKQPPSLPKQPTNPPQTLRQDSQATLIDENLDNLSSQLKQVVLDQERKTLNTSTKEERTIDGFGSMSFLLSTPDILSTDIPNQPPDYLLRHIPNQRSDYNPYSSNIPERSNPYRTKTQRSSTIHRNDETNSRKTDDNWLNMLEKLEHEHRTRLEKQQQQYEDYMHTLEEKMERRYDDYLTLTNGFQESRLYNYDDTIRIHRTHRSIPIDSNIGRYKTHSYNHQYRPLAKNLVSHYYPADSTLNMFTTEKKRSTISNNIPQSQSREDIINLRTEHSAKHAKYIADLKLYYEYEINELKSELNRARMGNTSNNTRKSIETIERINNENIRLRDEVNELRHSLKMTEDENILLKKQLEELREQLNTKDLDLKNYHRTIADLEQQLTEAENTKEQQDEISRHADRQVLLYQKENERIKIDLNLSMERLIRLEERYREQENENETLRRQVFLLENDTNRLKTRMNDDHKLSSTMALDVPTSREYGRFTLTTTAKNSSTSRDGNINTGRYQSNNTENLFRHAHSPRPMTRISDYLNERPVFPQPYVSPSKYIYSPRKSPPNRRRVEPISTRNSTDRQTRQNEQLEQKFDQLLKKKRDLETRLNRIPIRGITNTDRQLCDVLEREIDRVEQQISSVKLELRKLNILRTH